MHVNVKQHNEVLDRSSKPEKEEKTVAFCPACSVCSSCNFPGQPSSFDGNKTRMNRSETSTWSWLRLMFRDSVHHFTKYLDEWLGVWPDLGAGRNRGKLSGVIKSEARSHVSLLPLTSWPLGPRSHKASWLKSTRMKWDTPSRTCYVIRSLRCFFFYVSRRAACFCVAVLSCCYAACLGYRPPFLPAVTWGGKTTLEYSYVELSCTN